MGGGKFNGQPRKNIADIDILRIFAHRFISSEEMYGKNAYNECKKRYVMVLIEIDKVLRVIHLGYPISGLWKSMMKKRHI